MTCRDMATRNTRMIARNGRPDRFRPIAAEFLDIGDFVEAAARGVAGEGFLGANDEDYIADACLDATIAKTFAELHWMRPVNRRFVEQVSRPAENAAREET